MTHSAAEMRTMATFHQEQADQIELQAAIAEQNGRDDIEVKRLRRAAMRAGDTASMLRQAADAMEGGVWISHEMNDFLHGSGALDGFWWGERHVPRKGAFWWRRLLPESRATKAMAATPAREG